MKKIILPAVLLFALCLAGIFIHLREPAGDAPESREKILRALPKGIAWNISSEVEIDGYIVSAISASGQDGLAVFEPAPNGRYECRGTSYRAGGEIVTTELYTSNTVYHVCWLNRADLDHAELRFETQDGSETIRLAAQDLLPVYTRAPGGDYDLHIEYHTTDGTVVE